MCSNIRFLFRINTTAYCYNG